VANQWLGIITVAERPPCCTSQHWTDNTHVLSTSV